MSGRQEYREFRPVELYDVAAVESWLEERDREGYHLRGSGGLRNLLSGLLRRSQPLPAPAPVAQREVSAAGDDGCLQRAGVGICLHLGGDPSHIWRCGDPAAPELDTDPVVQGEGYRYLKRRMIFRTVGGGLIWLAMTAYFILAVALSVASLENILRNASWLGFVAAPLVAAALLTILGMQLWLDAGTPGGCGRL